MPTKWARKGSGPTFAYPRIHASSRKKLSSGCEILRLFTRTSRIRVFSYPRDATQSCRSCSTSSEYCRPFPSFMSSSFTSRCNSLGM